MVSMPHCKSRQDLKTLEELGLGGYDKDVSAGILGRRVRLNESGSGFFGGLPCIYEHEPNDEIKTCEIQAILTVVRKRIYFNGDDGTHYTDYFDEYEEFFSPEKCENIVKAFIEKGFIRPNFDASKIGKAISETVLCHAVPYAKEIAAYGKFFNEFYDFIPVAMTFDFEKFDAAIKSEIPPDQYKFVKWLSQSDYEVTGKGFIKFAHRYDPDKKLVMDRASRKIAKSAIKNLRNWVNSSQFTAALKAAIL